MSMDKTTAEKIAQLKKQVSKVSKSFDAFMQTGIEYNDELRATEIDVSYMREALRQLEALTQPPVLTTKPDTSGYCQCVDRSDRPLIDICLNCQLVIYPPVVTTGPKEEGDKCRMLECEGKYGYHPVENCSCHISPPCYKCVENPMVCLDCGDGLPDADPKPQGEAIENKPADPLRDGRVFHHDFIPSENKYFCAVCADREDHHLKRQTDRLLESSKAVMDWFGEKVYSTPAKQMQALREAIEAQGKEAQG